MKGIFVEGVRGAFIRLIRLIVYILIILTITFIVGLITNKKAHALSLEGTVSQPAMINSERKQGGTYSGTGTLWYATHFESNMVIPQNNTYDLLAFKIIRLNYSSNTYESNSYTGTYTQGAENSTTQQDTQYPIQFSKSSVWVTNSGSYLTVYGYMGTTNMGNVACFTTSEIDNYVFCPIKPGMSINAFWLEIAYDTGYASLTLNYEIRSERSFYNYDNHTIVNQQQTIITQQQQQNDYVQDNTTTGAQNDSTNALGGLQQTFSQKMTGMNELTQMVFAPIQMMLTVSSGTCIPMEWDIPFVNTHVVIPCMSTIYNNYFSLFITMFSTVIMGIYAYRSVLKLVNCIKDILDAENDKLEVLEL